MYSEISILLLLCFNALCLYVDEAALVYERRKKRAECIVELYKHEGIFKKAREVLRERRAVGECFSHFSSVLKNSQVLI